MSDNARTKKSFDFELEDYLSFEQNKNDIIIPEHNENKTKPFSALACFGVFIQCGKKKLDLFIC